VLWANVLQTTDTKTPASREAGVFFCHFEEDLLDNAWLMR